MASTQVSLPPDVVGRLAEQFPSDGGAAALAVLSGIPGLTPRVARCVVFLASGDLSKLTIYAQAATEDPRDAIFWAEYENHEDRSPRWVRDFTQPFDSGGSTVRNLLRNALAILAGVVIGGVVNTALITVGPSLIPPPAGVDMSTAEGLSQGMHLLGPRHFIMPFLAHALGTLAGALAAYLIAARYKAQIAYVIGAVFLCGGLAASFMIPAPSGFIALDLLTAYLPMAWLGVWMGTRLSKHRRHQGAEDDASLL